MAIELEQVSTGLLAGINHAFDRYNREHTRAEVPNVSPGIIRRYQCYDFALEVLTGITKKWIFDQFSFVEDPITWMEKQGWKQIQEPHAGDLIFYATEKAWEAYPHSTAFWQNLVRQARPPYVNHIGVCLDPGGNTVLSKMGQEGIWVHHRDEVKEYGRTHHFFRKNQNR
jgi:hypothetical protein